ncbi:MAG: polyprenyl synthetase family protein, partial [Ktedonobacterales bacterium]
RDDLLGIWSAAELGKTPGGDLRQKKMTLPVLHAFETAAPADRALLEAMYSESQAASEAQIATALAILERTGARARVRDALRQAAHTARAALDEAAGAAPQAREAHSQLTMLLDWVIVADI